MLESTNKARLETHLSGLDQEKLRKIADIKQSYDDGALNVDQARQALIEAGIQSIHPHELAYIEQVFQEFSEDECQTEKMEHIHALYKDLLTEDRPELSKDHPLAHYYAENAAMSAAVESIVDLVQYPPIKNQWIELYEQLLSWKTHLARKQHQLYPVLEEKGFDRPTTTMWTLDNVVRDEIKELYHLAQTELWDVFIPRQDQLIADIRDLIDKENSILFPTAYSLLTPEDWEYMRKGDAEIGFCFGVAGEAPEETATSQEDPTGLAQDLLEVLARHNLTNAPHQDLDVANGNLTLEQINLIFRHLPVDIAYVDEHELVRFYNDSPERIFPRSRNVIGRNVKNCHPHASVHVVSKILDEFRAGTQKEAEFWIQKSDVFIYIKYVAVHDSEGTFRGVLEMMQECSHIRSLEGSQTLLSWDQDTDNTSKGSEEHEDSCQHGCAQQDDAAAHHPQEQQKLIQELSAETRLKDLLDAFPTLKQRLPELHPNFRALSTPLARIMIPKARVYDMADRCTIALDDFIDQLRTLLEELAKDSIR